jgi:6-pyruvoyltetrahydropterin/6-carboxytetrahydropterin synthase
MNILLHTEGWFDAAHHLEKYDGPCSTLHGHTYKLEVWIKGDSQYLDEAGILCDFGYIKELTKRFDHKGDMTKIMGVNSTAEKQAMYFYKDLKREYPNLEFKVRVYEQLEPKRSWAQVGDFE